MKLHGIRVVAVLAFGVAALGLGRPEAAEPAQDRRGEAVYLDKGKVEESEAKGQLGEPHFGYVGDLGTFAAMTKNANGLEAHAAYVVHQYPHQEKLALGCTKLKYQGPKRLSNVDGWVFATEWDGKVYPSKVFLSAQKVYFGGGKQAYIAADYRNDTGWAWKLLPLRRMEIAKAGQGTESR